MLQHKLAQLLKLNVAHMDISGDTLVELSIEVVDGPRHTARDLLSHKLVPMTNADMQNCGQASKNCMMYNTILGLSMTIL